MFNTLEREIVDKHKLFSNTDAADIPSRSSCYMAHVLSILPAIVSSLNTAISTTPSQISLHMLPKGC